MKQASALFKNILLSVAIPLLVALILPGCATQQENQYVQRTVPVPEIQYVDATLIVGKTTKQEVLNALGMPAKIDDTSLSYSYDRTEEYLRARLHIVQEDGTEFNVILGNGLRYTSLLVFFGGSYDDKGRHIPSNINTSISVH